MCSSMNLRRAVSVCLFDRATQRHSLLPYRNQGGLQSQRVFLRPRVLGQLLGDPAPIPEDADIVLVHLTVGWVNAGEVDHADEVDLGGLFRVVRAALHLELVDAVLVVALQREKSAEAGVAGSCRLSAYMRRAPDGSPPVCHVNVLRILETVRARA